jgi:LemA protein
LALGEAYPDLKASANFQQLQGELSDIENKIAAARRFFNNSAEYNTGIQFRPPSRGRSAFSSGILRSRESRGQLEQPPQVKF